MAAAGHWLRVAVAWELWRQTGCYHTLQGALQGVLKGALRGALREALVWALVWALQGAA